MRCIKPLTLRDAEDRARTVPCGRCNFCLMANRMDWTIRVMQEAKTAGTAHFLTLTYHDDYLDYSPSGLPQLQRDENGKPSHLQQFFKRLRKENAKHCDWSIRYFAIGEYGETYERPHYHAILFNMHSNCLEKLDKIWPIGFHQLGTVTIASIHYVTGYIINRYHDYGDRNRPFALHSRKPGLGANYIETHRLWHKPTSDESTFRNYTKINGITNRLPRYYRDRLFTKDELQYLNHTAAQQFDKDLAAELKRLSKLSPTRDPADTFKERIQHMHDKIKVIKNKNL